MCVITECCNDSDLSRTARSQDKLGVIILHCKIHGQREDYTNCLRIIYPDSAESTQPMSNNVALLNLF